MAEVFVVNENGVHFASPEDSVVHVMLDFPLDMDTIIANALQGDEEMLDMFTDHTVRVDDLLAVYDAAKAMLVGADRNQIDLTALRAAVAIADR